MSIYKSIDLSATGTTIEEAVAAAVNRASLTLEGVSSFAIERIDGTFEDGELTYRVLVRVSFVVREHLHE
ncbi:MAG TPA: dodecin family protein [Actinomycetota bacterium]|nr:dodecin family protein [Actinomycetota bacterium]